MLRCHNISALGYHSNETSGENFRKYLAYTMANNHIIAANFHRTEVGEVGGGHWSPVVAYNPSVDMVLLAGKPVHIMILFCVRFFADTEILTVNFIIVYADVARYKYGPLWVPVDQLFSAMLTMDSTSQQFRGFLVLSAKDITSDLDVLLLVASSNENGGSFFNILLAAILIPIAVVIVILLLAAAYKLSPYGRSKKDPKSSIELFGLGGYNTVGSSTHASDAGLGLAPLPDKRAVKSDAASSALPSSSHSQSVSRSHEEEVEEGTTTISVESY
jgi:hypothetical protein